MRVLLCVVLALGAPPAGAGSPPDGAAAPRPPADPCAPESADGSPGLDRLRAGVTRSVCQSSRWFDGLFGDPRHGGEVYQAAYGRLGAGLGWDGLDGITVDGHLRAHVPLPALGERVNAVFGRDSEEHFINDEVDEVNFLATSFSDDRSANWYAGLGYLAASDPRSRFDLSAGVQLASPLNPFLKARYTHVTRPHEAVLLTARATAFWENDDGLGVTLAGDADWALHPDWLLRWANTLGYSEATAGLAWKTRVGLYQVLSRRSALRYEASMRGETDGRQPDLYGLRVTHRRALWREWLFVELSGSLFWAANDDPARRCAGCVGVAAGFEILFGDRYDDLLQRGRDRPPAADAPPGP